MNRRAPAGFSASVKIAASKSVLVSDFRRHRSNNVDPGHRHPLADLLHSQIGLTPRYRLTGESGGDDDALGSHFVADAKLVVSCSK